MVERFTRRIGDAVVTGSRPEAEIVFVVAHPTNSTADSFLFDALERRSAGVVGVDNRFIGDAAELLFADAAFDVAAAIEAVTAPRSRVVLVGHSGGGPLMILTRVRYRVGAALVLLAAHPSRAQILRDWIDPAIDDDGRRRQDLDLYAADRTVPLSPTFVAAYRAAQCSRLETIAEHAAGLLRRGQGLRRMSIANVCADPRFVDASLDPNDRDLAAFPFGAPAEVNARPGFLLGEITARSFFDQWYLPTTSANALTLAPALDVPVLNLVFGADGLVFPTQSDALAAALPASAITDVLEDAPHHLHGRSDVVERLADRLIRWAAG